VSNIVLGIASGPSVTSGTEALLSTSKKREHPTSGSKKLSPRKERLTSSSFASKSRPKMRKADNSPVASDIEIISDENGSDENQEVKSKEEVSSKGKKKVDKGKGKEKAKAVKESPGKKSRMVKFTEFSDAPSSVLSPKLMIRGSEEELPAIDAARAAGLLPPVPLTRIFENPLEQQEQQEQEIDGESTNKEDPNLIIDLPKEESAEKSEHSSEETIGKDKKSKTKGKGKGRTVTGPSKP
jgi:hypothetical protein